MNLKVLVSSVTCLVARQSFGFEFRIFYVLESFGLAISKLIGSRARTRKRSPRRLEARLVVYP